jgi:hypothetical protein
VTRPAWRPTRGRPRDRIVARSRAADNLLARPVAAAAVQRGDPGGRHSDGDRVPDLRPSGSSPRRHGTALGTATADANGWFTAGEVTPSSTPPGTYVVTSNGGGQTLAAQLVVTWSGSYSSAGTAPRTAPGALTIGTPSSGSWGGGGSGNARTSGASSAGRVVDREPATVRADRVAGAEAPTVRAPVTLWQRPHWPTMPSPDRRWRGPVRPHWYCWRWPVGCSSCDARARPPVELADQWWPGHRATPGKRGDSWGMTT